jgi:hypothetical protein
MFALIRAVLCNLGGKRLCGSMTDFAIFRLAMRAMTSQPLFRPQQMRRTYRLDAFWGVSAPGIGAIVLMLPAYRRPSINMYCCRCLALS